MLSEKLVPINARVPEVIFRDFKLAVVKEGETIQEVIARLMQEYVNKKNEKAKNTIAN